MHSTATTDPKSYNEHRRIRLSLKAKMLQTQNTENIACEMVEVWPILLLAPPPSTVGQKTVPMFGCFAMIEVEQIKKIR